jgi:ribosomal protein L30
MGRMLLTIEQTGSPIRTNKRRKEVEPILRGLALNRIGRTSQVPDTPTIRGMIGRVSHIVEIIYFQIDIRHFAQEVRAEYQHVIVGPTSRITRGEVLWDRFEDAGKRCLADPDRDDRELTECVNEIAVAALLATDKALVGRRIEYEPPLLPDGRRIDFVVDRGADNLYIEVKTVRPKTADGDAAWEKFLRLKKYHPKTIDYMVTREGMGGAIHGNEYAARAHFLDYTLAFEERLAAAKAIKPGPGIVVFCGNGFAWRLSNLEDFADFYRTGRHRADDPFGPMEQHHIQDTGSNSNGTSITSPS